MACVPADFGSSAPTSSEVSVLLGGQIRFSDTFSRRYHLQLCRALRSGTEQFPNQAAIAAVKMLSSTPEHNAVRMARGVRAPANTPVTSETPLCYSSHSLTLLQTIDAMSSSPSMGDESITCGERLAVNYSPSRWQADPRKARTQSSPFQHNLRYLPR